MLKADSCLCEEKIQHKQEERKQEKVHRSTKRKRRGNVSNLGPKLVQADKGEERENGNQRPSEVVKKWETGEVKIDTKVKRLLFS